jgi:rod shape determining protein RodA
MKNYLNSFKYFDIPLQITCGLLLLVGLVIIYGTSISGNSMEVFWRQVVYAIGGVVIYLFFAFYDYHRLAKFNRISYFVILALLIFVLVFAREIKGSTRWIDFGFFQLQPAEFAKIVVILGLSRWMYLKRGQINSWKNIIITAVYTLIPAILIMREPDLGSSVILIGVWAGLLLISPMSKKYIVTLVLMAVILSGIGWQFGLHDYQQRRIEVFLNPDLDPRGQGYNVRQAIIAVGSGQLFGRGLGQGLQGQLNFLPERQTDFIFASASEEIGFLGVAGLLALYCFLFLRLLSIMKMAKDDLAFYIVGGVLFMLFGQVLINIGMNIGLMPVTGIPLPFLSYGGSSLIVVMISLGIVQNIAKQSKSLRF